MISRFSVGRPIDVELRIFSECKYGADESVLDNPRRVNYKGVDHWEIWDRDDAEKIESETDGSCIDDYHEYLVLVFTSGETATFRESYVDMFRA